LADYDCRNCKRWEGCVGKAWYSYADLRWCPLQVIWLIQHAEIFKSGKWPIEEGAQTEGGGKQVKREAPFVKPEIIIAELEHRLKKTGIQGQRLIAQIKAGRDINALNPRAYEALMYVKGWRRKRMSFTEWKNQRRCVWLIYTLMNRKTYSRMAQNQNLTRVLNDDRLDN
jgi:hypothetical protein